ncbi:MAG: ATP-dependent helicase, partial [Candidatus Nomurabacteria bacterium]|nr:ATP-dependent helicase [Candidatus Nomurabacteria bacterium]
YFFDGAQFAPADEITKLEIINDILRGLPHDNPLAGTHDDQATRLREVQRAISDVKRKGGFSAENLVAIARQNLEFIDFTEPILAETFADKMSPKNLPLYKTGYENLAKFANQKSSLATVVINEFADAINDAVQSGKTNQITKFKDQYFNTKNRKMKDRGKSENVLALAAVYEQYQAELGKRGLYDFDDMIVEIIVKLTDNADFRADLQEQYQYILVDEFQDTNDAQMKILTLLADAPDSNIMVVGDDDQAIFSFQGANANNMRQFIAHYPAAQRIQLFENYRSEDGVLRLADQIISGAETRIKRGFFESVSELLARREHQTGEKIEYISTATDIDEAAWVAEQTARELAEKPTREIAIISREHKDLENLLPFLHRTIGPNIEYERRSNVLDSPPIRALEILARIICYIADGAHGKANELLPELLAHPAWQIPAREVWQLSLATERGGRWLETITGTDSKASTELKNLADWLIETSKEIKNQTMETAIDTIFAKVYKVYYLSEAKLAENPNAYLEYLSDLITLRDKVREYQTDAPTLQTFIQTIDLYRKYDLKILAQRQFGDKARVHLMSVHKAKGLEFDTVFMYHGTRDKWLKKSSERFFPTNLRLTLPHELDENLRLIYVAATRAKHRLFITAPEKSNAKGEDLTILPVLGNIQTRRAEIKSQPIENLETAWSAPFLNVNKDLKSLLAPVLKDYKLNATAINAFTNLEYAGPEKFLLHNLLRFPQAKSPAADYGTAVHETMKFAHGFYNKNARKPNADEIKKVFMSQLKSMRMLDVDYQFYLGKGNENLLKFIAKHQFNPNQRVEQVFEARLGEMNLTGKMDLIEIDEKTRRVVVADYKTGGAFDQFNKGKIKTHNYWQQLIFYKLLIENANNRPGLKIDKAIIYFIEAADDEPQFLEIDYREDEVQNFIKLLTAIWEHIQNLDFPKVDDYPKNLRGTLEFENDLSYRT